ncbi:MAG TPA: hypothetical protein PLJ35_19410 [Anaerolineae bacterium]|nr:hypothetical protein [Anaerolineae bacterium]
MAAKRHSSRSARPFGTFIRQVVEWFASPVQAGENRRFDELGRDNTGQPG